MKGKEIFLDELRPTTKAYKVKVRVIAKGRPKTSLAKNLRYQSLMLKDDKGNRMKGALFGEQVDGFKNALVYNGVYEISNAPIKYCAGQWKNSPAELDYQMSFGRQTIMQPVEAEHGNMGPQYCCIANIPREGDVDDTIDVLGVVLYVDPEPRKVVTGKAYDTFVREILTADHSTEMSFIISSWNDLAETECDALSARANNFSIMGFTVLKVSAHKGFSLATTMSTTFVHDPTGERANGLAEWALRHQDALANRQRHIFVVRNPSKEKSTITIATLRLKKPASTLPEEHHWLRVKIPTADLARVYTYLGCSRCSTRSELPLAVVYECERCSKKECVSFDRVTLNCEIVDDNGSLSVTMFTKECEALFRMPAAEIVRVKQSNDTGTFQTIQQNLGTTFTLVEVGPTAALAKNSILQWVPKTVVIEEANNHLASGKDPIDTVTATQDNIIPRTPPKQVLVSRNTYDVHATSSRHVVAAAQIPEKIPTSSASEHAESSDHPKIDASIVDKTIVQPSNKVVDHDSMIPATPPKKGVLIRDNHVVHSTSAAHIVATPTIPGMMAAVDEHEPTLKGTPAQIRSVKIEPPTVDKTKTTPRTRTEDVCDNRGCSSNHD